METHETLEYCPLCHRLFPTPGRYREPIGRFCPDPAHWRAAGYKSSELDEVLVRRLGRLTAPFYPYYHSSNSRDYRCRDLERLDASDELPDH
jgi:hypothetical protein